MESKKGLENTCKLYGQASAKKLDKGYRNSQWPGTGLLEQEWVLLQLTEINGVGDKGRNSHRSKTTVNAYGRKEGIAKYHSWCTNTKTGPDGFVNRSTSCLEKFQSFWKSREEDEADPVSTPPPPNRPNPELDYLRED
jgi:hypothetical protein